MVCEEPILVVSFKVGLCRVDPKGKDCRTVFQRLSFDGRSSVVRCLPLTGRTHQIRVHLQYLGFPILNDPIYGSSAWGPNRAKGGMVDMSNEEILEALIDEHRSKESLHLLDLPDEEMEKGKRGPKTESSDGALDHNSLLKSVTESSDSACDGSSCEVLLVEGKDVCNSRPTCETEAERNDCKKEDCVVDEHPNTTKSNAIVRDHLCGECKIVRPDPAEKDLVMYLHALRYKGPDFEYSTRLPDWAKEDWVQV